MIEIRHVRKSFGSVDVLRDVNATIKNGEIISIIGPSGTGKSTLLRCLNLLERPTSGEILVDGVDLLSPEADVPAIRRKVGMVFQQFNLFPHLTVLENVTVSPRTLCGVSAKAANERAMELLKLVGLEQRAFALPRELSGGQCQRVAIARTLAMEPEAILFDEPTSALDPTMVDEVLHVISDLGKTGITMVIVTHEMRFARDVSSRVFYMDEGVVYESGAPEQVFGAPKRPKTVAFVNRLDGMSVVVRRGEFDALVLRRPFNSMFNRYGVTADDIVPQRGAALRIVRDVLLKEAEVVDIWVGVSKGTRQPEAFFTWEGNQKNPLTNFPELEKYLRTYFRSYEFSVDDDNRSQLRLIGFPFPAPS